MKGEQNDAAKNDLNTYQSLWHVHKGREKGMKPRCWPGPPR